MAQVPQGLFGLPAADRETLLRLRRQQADQRFENRLDRMGEGTNPLNRNVMESFARLSRAATPEEVSLTPGEERRFDAADAVRKRVLELRASDDFQALDPAAQRRRLMGEVGKLAMDYGDYSTASNLFGAMTQSAREEAKFQTQQEQERIRTNLLQAEEDAIPLETRMKELRNKQLDLTNERTRQALDGEAMSVVDLSDLGPGGLQGANIEDLVVSGIMRGTEFQTQDGRTIDTFVSVPEAIAIQREARQLSEAGDATTTGDRLEAFRKSLGSAATREHFNAANNYVSVAEGFSDAMNMLSEVDDPSQIVGPTGTAVRAVRGFFNAAKSAGRAFIPGVGVGERGEDGRFDESVPADPEALAKHYKDFIVVPDGYTGQAASRYRSTVMQLAYAQARALDPGARQLSDQDIRNSLDSLGAQGTSPSTIVNTFVDNIRRSSAALEDRARRVATQGATMYGIEPDVAQKAVFGSDVLSNIAKFQNQFEEQANLLSATPIRSEEEEDQEARERAGDAWLQRQLDELGELETNPAPILQPRSM